jgi:hypothetical protein
MKEFIWSFVVLFMTCFYFSAFLIDVKNEKVFMAGFELFLTVVSFMLFYSMNFI